MSTSTRTRARRVGTRLALAGASLLPLTAFADGAVAPAAEPTAPSATSGQIAVRDAVSGQLRAATPEEALALQPAARSPLRAARSQPMPRAHVSGAQGARLTDEFMSYSVLVRQPDGRLVEQCLQSKEAADAAVKAAPATSSTPITANLPTE